jgi:hypothetical protein
MTDDEKVARRYRELEAEEPPRALDEAILAAARHPRAGERRATRPWTQRLAVPLSLAAVLVLSVTVTLRIQHEQPGIESPVPQVKEPVPQAKEPVPAASAVAPVAEAQPMPKAAVQKKKLVAQEEPEPFPAAVQGKLAEDGPPAPAAAPVPEDSLASRRDAARSAESSAAGAAARNEAAPAAALMRAPAAKAALADTPERELERIAGLRRLGMHDEADKALAEFRKRYPDYTIPEAMRARVERR